MKSFKKIASGVIVAAMLMACASISAFAASPASVTGTTDDDNEVTFNVTGDDNEATTTQAEIDVQAKVYDQSTGVYSIAVAWGDMKFAYKDDTTVWDPAQHEYVSNSAEGTVKEWTESYLDGENNKITVTNHSNVGVGATFAYTMENQAFNDATGDDNVAGYFFDSNDNAKAAAKVLTAVNSTVANKLTDNKISLATAVNTQVASAPADDVFFAFAGTPDVGRGAVLKEFTKVGTIVITFSPVA